MKKYRLWACCACVVAGLLVLILVFSAAGVRAQSNTAAPDPSLLLSPPADPPPEQQGAAPEEGLNALQETGTLQVRVEEIPPKDFWDIVGSLSGIIAALVVVVVGRWAAGKYENSQLAIQKIEAVRSSMSCLQSSDPREVEAGLLTISVADLSLAMELAKVFEGPPMETALSSLADRPEREEVAQAAQKTREYLEKTKQAGGLGASGETAVAK